MNKTYLTIACFIFFINANAQIIPQNIKDKLPIDSAARLLSNNKNDSDKSVTDNEVVSGLKEALRVGASQTVSLLGAKDGFFGNSAIKILMPPEAAKAEQTLRRFGLSSTVDKAILSMNEAAEYAVSGMGGLLSEAIASLTINDGIRILKGGDTAATQYLRKTTQDSLQTRMKPRIDAALSHTKATAYWKDVFTQYNRFVKQPVTADLGQYVTDKTINGIFYQIAIEEKKIRQNPPARISDLLKKVFGQ